MKFKILKGFRYKGQFFAKDAGQEAALLASKPTSEEVADWTKRGLIEGDAGESEPSSPSTAPVASFASLRAQSEAVTNELLEALEDEAEDEETPVEALTRIINERNTAQSDLWTAQSKRDSAQLQLTQSQRALQSVQEEVEGIASQISGAAPFERRSDESALQSLARYAQVVQTSLDAWSEGQSAQGGQMQQQLTRDVQKVATEAEVKKSGTPISPEELTKATNAPLALAILNAGFDTKEKIRGASNEQLTAIENVGEQTIKKLRELAK